VEGAWPLPRCCAPPSNSSVLPNRVSHQLS
jgi:hypothetical protein